MVLVVADYQFPIRGMELGSITILSKQNLIGLLQTALINFVGFNVVMGPYVVPQRVFYTSKQFLLNFLIFPFFT